MVRLTELPLEVIIEIIKQVPQGLVASEYPSYTPDWSQVSKSEQNQNDKDQIQLYQLIRVNRLFRACVLRSLNTPRQWPYYLPAVKDGAIAMTFKEQIAQGVEREGGCFERLKIRAAASKFGLLLEDYLIILKSLMRSQMSMARDLIPRAPNVSNEEIRECISRLISQQEELSQNYLATQTAVSAQRRGNVNLDQTYLLSGDHAVEQTCLSFVLPALESSIIPLKARFAELA